ncbi:MAG TPA: sigma-70 family RNA polymerase sigma factor [Thermoanaerobaculia bacterium]
MKPEDIYLQELRTIERIATSVARRSHLNPDETAEFVQEVRVRLLEDDYAVIRKHEGRSKLSTYLHVVIMRLYHQWRVEQWGKWRPSAEAKRIGDKAVTLERLLTRDGYTFQEAVKVLTTPAGSVFTTSELESLYERLPLRTPRPVMVPDDDLPEAVAVDADADERIESGDRARSARTAARTMDSVIGTFEPEDRVILQMRFWDARNVPDIARTLHLEQKKLYKRFEKLLGVLRRGLESAGVTKAEVGRLLRHGDQDIHLDLVSSGGNGAFGPSHQSGGKGRGGERRPR